jgi:hypothetical protein
MKSMIDSDDNALSSRLLCRLIGEDSSGVSRQRWMGGQDVGELGYDRSDADKGMYDQHDGIIILTFIIINIIIIIINIIILTIIIIFIMLIVICCYHSGLVRHHCLCPSDFELRGIPGDRSGDTEAFRGAPL